MVAEKLYKFTFKKQQLGDWVARIVYDVKYNKIEVGNIAESDDRKWVISLQSPASEKALERNPNCPWMWITVKQAFDTYEEARTWLNENREMILEKIYFE